MELLGHELGPGVDDDGLGLLQGLLGPHLPPAAAATAAAAAAPHVLDSGPVLPELTQESDVAAPGQQLHLGVDPAQAIAPGPGPAQVLVDTCLLPWVVNQPNPEMHVAALQLAQLVLSQPPLCQQALHHLKVQVHGLYAHAPAPQLLDHGVPVGDDVAAAAAGAEVAGAAAGAAAAAADGQGSPGLLLTHHPVVQQLLGLLADLLQHQEGGGDVKVFLEKPERRSVIAALLVNAYSTATAALVTAVPHEGSARDDHHHHQQQQQQGPADAATGLKQVYATLQQQLQSFFAKDLPKDLVPPAALIMPPKVATGRAAAGAGTARDFNFTNAALLEVPGWKVEVEGVLYKLYFLSALGKPPGAVGGGSSSSDLQLPAAPATMLEPPPGADTAAAPRLDMPGAAPGPVGGPYHLHVPTAGSSAPSAPPVQSPHWPQQVQVPVQQQQQPPPPQQQQQYMMVPAAPTQLPHASPFAANLSQLDIPAAAAAAAGGSGLSPGWGLRQQQQQQQQPTSPLAAAAGLEDRLRMCALAIRPSKGVPVSGQPAAPGAAVVPLPDVAWLQPMNNSKLGANNTSGAGSSGGPKAAGGAGSSNSSSSRRPERAGVGEAADKAIRLFCLGLLINRPQRRVTRQRSSSGTLKRNRSSSAPGTSQPPPGDATA